MYTRQVGYHSHCDPVQPVYLASHHLLVLRFGEALHPGPEAIRFAISNPTSIVNKEREYSELRNLHGVHIVAAAETAATNKGQRVFRHKIRPAFPRSIWSPPVAEKRERSDGDESLRGQASGVALLSVLPVRAAHGTLPYNMVSMSCRLIHALVAVGHVQIQVLVMYGS